MDIGNPNKSQIRVVGGGHTLFFYDGIPIALLDSVQDGGQRPMGGQPYQAITSIGDKRPRELVLQEVLSEGSLTLTLREVWNKEVWYRLGSDPGGLGVADDGLYSGTHSKAPYDGGALIDIQRIFELQNQNQLPQKITVSRLIYPPGEDQPIRGVVYQNPTITAADTGDRVTVAELSVTKTITVTYTHVEDITSKLPRSQFAANYARR